MTPSVPCATALVACTHAAWEATLSQWAAWRWPQAIATTVRDAEALARQLETLMAEGAVLEGDPELLESWRRAVPRGADLWVAIAEPRPAALAAAIALQPAGLLTWPLGATLVEGVPGAPPAGSAAAEALLAKARQLAEAATGGRHWKWLKALLGAYDAHSEAWELLAPPLLDHVLMEGAERALHEPHPTERELAELVIPVACRAAAACAERGIRIGLGETSGRLTLPFGPAYRVLTEATSLLASSLPPAGRLSISGEGGPTPEVVLTREPGSKAPPSPAAHLAELFSRAREADAALSLDQAAWPALTLCFGVPAVPPLPVPAPQTVVLEPDPLIRAWLRELPGGRSLLMPPWRPGEPLPPQATAAEALVLVDRPFAEAVRAALGPDQPLWAQPIRARFGQGGGPALFTPARSHPGPGGLAGGVDGPGHAGEAGTAPAGATTGRPAGGPGPSTPEPRSSNGRSGARRQAAVGLALAAVAAGLAVGMLPASPGRHSAPVSGAAPAEAAEALGGSSERAASKGLPREVVVDLGSRTLVVREGPREVLRLPVAVGAPAHPTPPGRFRVTLVAVDPPYFKGGSRLEPYRRDPRNPLGTRWIGLSTPGIGLHGTSDPASIGGATTDGCVRLTNRHAEWLADLVRPGTPVTILAGPPGKE